MIVSFTRIIAFVLTIFLGLTAFTTCRLKHPQKTIATIVLDYQIHNGFGYYTIEYFARDKKYIDQLKGYDLLINPLAHYEERFILFYDSIHPGRHSQMVIPALEKPVSAIGVITKTYPGRQFFSFEYIVSDKKFTNNQYYEKEKYNIKAGDKFEVKYEIVNPNNSILLLDSLASDTISGKVFHYLKIK